jgi:hypothetical protein
MQKRKIMLVADMTPVIEEETHTTPWGRVWTHGADVMATWKRHGFVPPTEYRDDFMFKINREAAKND